MKVFDAFLFSYNPDILEIRLNVLNDVVDKFVIVESPYGWHGTYKGLEFCKEENLKRFEKFLHKIEYVVVLDMPKYEGVEGSLDEGPALVLETFNRDAIERGLKDADDDDLIIVSDFDEIPRPEVIEQIKHHGSGEVWLLKLPNFIYRMNILVRSNHFVCANNIIFKKKYLENNTISDMRWNFRDKFFRGQKDGFTVVPNAGWHFSWIGDEEFINKKLDHYRHETFRSESGRREAAKKLEDAISGNAEGCVYVFLDEFFPQYLLDNKDKYADIICASHLQMSANKILEEEDWGRNDS